VDIKTDVEVVQDDQLDLSRTEELNIYRIFMELIQNIRKHETESFIRVKIEVKDGVFTARIYHDGEGISDEEVNKLMESSEGLGLNSLKSRVNLLNGDLKYYNSNDLKITLNVPLSYEKKD
jgi:signal transduction histidine kinase